MLFIVGHVYSTTDRSLADLTLEQNDKQQIHLSFTKIFFYLKEKWYFQANYFVWVCIFWAEVAFRAKLTLVYASRFLLVR